MRDPANSRLLDRVKSIGADATRLMDVLTTRAADDAELTSGELAAIDRLIRQSEAVLSDASQLARKRRRKQIGQLKKLLTQLDGALATPGLSVATRTELGALKRRKRAQLVGLLARESMDFGGILTVTQVRRIEDVLKRARRTVARKKKAAAFLGIVLEVVDISLSIVGKVGVGRPDVRSA